MTCEKLLSKNHTAKITQIIKKWAVLLNNVCKLFQITLFSRANFETTIQRAQKIDWIIHIMIPIIFFYIFNKLLYN